eukprot:XP_013985405.1 PREDICTED: mitochondrial dynamics protein MID49-like isoform X2 [Salmo salar]
MDFRWGRSRGEEGIAVVINFLLANARLVLGVGGAAVLGIATLAVKRLIERAGRAADDEKVEQKMSESWEELSLVSASPKSIRKGLEGVVMKHVAKATKPQKADLCQPQQQKSSLDEKPVKASESQRPKNLQLSLTLQVVRADHACLLVPLQLEPSLWRLIPGEETLLTHPLHWMVRRVNLEYFPRGRSYWDRFLVGGYLSCRALVNMLSKAVMETMNWPSLSYTLDCLVRPVLGGDELKLEIRYLTYTHTSTF